MDYFLFESIDDEDVFQTEEDCEKFLTEKRWANGFCCPRCDHHLFYKIKTRHLLECKECRTQISLTAGTVMHKSKLPLTLWFKAIKELVASTEDYSTTQFAELLQVNYRTSKLIMDKIHMALSKQFDRSSYSHKKQEITTSASSTNTNIIADKDELLVALNARNSCNSKSELYDHAVEKGRKPDISKRPPSAQRLATFRSFMLTNSRNVVYETCTLFKKWMDACLSVYLYPVFLKCYQLG